MNSENFYPEKRIVSRGSVILASTGNVTASRKAALFSK